MMMFQRGGSAATIATRMSVRQESRGADQLAGFRGPQRNLLVLPVFLHAGPHFHGSHKNGPISACAHSGARRRLARNKFPTSSCLLGLPTVDRAREGETPARHRRPESGDVGGVCGLCAEGRGDRHFQVSHRDGRLALLRPWRKAKKYVADMHSAGGERRWQ